MGATQTNTNRLRVVVVEDCPDLRELWRVMFSAASYDVALFETAQEALDHVQRQGGADVLVTDYFLPDMTGLELLSKAREQYPNLPCVLLTGHQDAELTTAVRQQEKVALLQKPVNFKHLTGTVEGLVS